MTLESWQTLRRARLHFQTSSHSLLLPTLSHTENGSHSTWVWCRRRCQFLPRGQWAHLRACWERSSKRLQSAPGRPAARLDFCQSDYSCSAGRRGFHLEIKTQECFKGLHPSQNQSRVRLRGQGMNSQLSNTCPKQSPKSNGGVTVSRTTSSAF